MFKRNRIAMILLALVLVLAMVACSSPTPADPGSPTDSGTSATPTPAKTDEGGSDPEPPDDGGEVSYGERTPVTFTMLIMKSATSTIDPWKDTPVGKLLEERTGVDLQLEFLVGADVRQKAALLIAAGEYPDLMTTGDAAGDFYAAGSWQPVTQYFSKYENLAYAYPEWKQNIMKQEDGEIYWFPTHPSENAVYPAAGYWLNMDLLAQNDYPVLTNMGEWEQLIVDYVAANPTYNGQPTLGISEATDAWRASGVQYGAARYASGRPNDGLTSVDQETLEAKIVMKSDFQKEWSKMLNRMWNHGIANPEMFMQTDEQFQAKVGSGRLAGLYEQRGFMQNGLDALRMNDESRMLVAFPVVFDGIETEMYRGYRNFSAGGGIGISVSCKDVERAVQFIDDMAREESQIAWRWGIEGVDWSYADDGTLYKTTEQWKKFIDVEYKRSQGIEQIDAWYIFPGLEQFPKSKTIASPTNTADYALACYTDVELEFLTHYEDRGYTKFIDWFNPSKDGWYMGGAAVRQRIPTDDPRKIAGETALEITIEYLAPLVTQCPTEEAFEKLWAEFQSKLDALPLSEYEELATQMIRDSVARYPQSGS